MGTTDDVRSSAVPPLETLIGRPSIRRAVLLGVLAINAALIIYTAQVTLRNFQNSGDEYAYWVSATLFSQGRMSAPPWEPRESFALYHTLNDDKFYGKYAPGWPFVLSLGMRAGLENLVNPLLGLLTLVVIYQLGRETYSPGVAALALATTLANPFIVLNSASYYSHPSGLFALTVCTLFTLRCVRQPDAHVPYVLAGAFAGLALLIRPYTALAVSISLAAMWMRLLRARLDRSAFWGRLGLALIPVVISVGLLLAYDQAQTGDPFLQPFMKYDPDDGLGKTPTSEGWSWALSHNVLARVLEWSEWIPLAIVFLALPWASAEGRKDAFGRVLSASAIGLFAAYIIYLRTPDNQYGPRYVYEASFAVFLLAGRCLSRLGRFRGLLILAGLILANASVLVTQSDHYGREVRERLTLVDLVRRQRLSNAIVLLRTGSGSMDPQDLTRNGVDPEPAVLYALDRGPGNRALFDRYLGRGIYVFEYDRATRTGRLIAMKNVN
jgi:hypothetical protein